MRVGGRDYKEIAPFYLNLTYFKQNFTLLKEMLYA